MARWQTVNPPGFPYAGSNPALSTTLLRPDGLRRTSPAMIGEAGCPPKPWRRRAATAPAFALAGFARPSLLITSEAEPRPRAGALDTRARPNRGLTEKWLDKSASVCYKRIIPRNAPTGNRGAFLLADAPLRASGPITIARCRDRSRISLPCDTDAASAASLSSLSTRRPVQTPRLRQRRAAEPHGTSSPSTFKERACPNNPNTAPTRPMRFAN